MDDQELDDYMDYYQRTWTDDDQEVRGPDADFRKAMLKMFPVPTLDAKNDTGIGTSLSADDLPFVQAVQASLAVNKVVPDEYAANDITRPGSHYGHYRSMAELPASAKPFYEATARMVGISIEILVFVVFHIEMRVQKWAKMQVNDQAYVSDEHDDADVYSD